MAIALVGCGGDEDKGEPIPAQPADRMVGLLDLAERRSADGLCRSAKAKVNEARGVLEGLPEEVNPDVRQELADGYDRLDELIDGECERPEREPEETTTVTTPEPTETTPTPTETTPTPTETTPTPTETTPTPTETTPTPENPGTGGTPPGQEDDG